MTTPSPDTRVRMWVDLRADLVREYVEEFEVEPKHTETSVTLERFHGLLDVSLGDGVVRVRLLSYRHDDTSLRMDAPMLRKEWIYRPVIDDVGRRYWQVDEDLIPVKEAARHISARIRNFQPPTV